MSITKDYRLVEVTCRDMVETPRTFRAGLSLRAVEDTGFRCSKCGELVPVAGNEIHDVRVISRREAAE